jgi:DNA polymerase-3 subunit epsilon
VSVGPLRGRAAAVELKEQLDSLFGLRHCGRTLPRRQWPSAYGQMGRCLSPCLGDLDPNLYRRRLDEALALFAGPHPGRALLDHVEAQMREAAAARRYERAGWLSRRRARLAELLDRLGEALAATHARPRLVLAGHPREAGRFDVLWLVDGRIADFAPLGDDAWERTERAMRGWRAAPATYVPPDEVDEVRVVTTWMATARPPALSLAGASRARVERFASRHLGRAAKCGPT